MFRLLLAFLLLAAGVNPAYSQYTVPAESTLSGHSCSSKEAVAGTITSDSGYVVLGYVTGTGSQQTTACRDLVGASSSTFFTTSGDYKYYSTNIGHYMRLSNVSETVFVCPSSHPVNNSDGTCSQEGNPAECTEWSQWNCAVAYDDALDCFNSASVNCPNGYVASVWFVDSSEGFGSCGTFPNASCSCSAGDESCDFGTTTPPIETPCDPLTETCGGDGGSGDGDGGSGDGGTPAEPAGQEMFLTDSQFDSLTEDNRKTNQLLADSNNKLNMLAEIDKSIKQGDSSIVGAIQSLGGSTGGETPEINFGPMVIAQQQTTAAVNEVKDVLTDSTLYEPSEGLTGFYTPTYSSIDAVFSEKLASIQSSEMFQFVDSFRFNSGSGSAPAFNLCFNMGIANFGCLDLQVPAYVWSFIRLVIIISALFLARRMIIGG